MKKQRSPFDRRTRRAHSDSHAWAVSYVDMLTLLLCFFIIFFSLKKDNVPTTFLQTIVKAFGDTKKVGVTKTSDEMTSEKEKKRSGSNTAYVSGGSASSNAGGTDLSMAPEMIKKIALTNFAKDYGKVGLARDQLIIEIPQVSFFPSAKRDLTEEGVLVTEKMIESLKPFMGKIHVTVQGHTDPRPYHGSNHQDNWELSVLRASKVLKYFIAAGFSQEDVSAEGFADQKSRRIAASGNDDKEELGYLRRITLKIREKGHD